MAPEDLNRLNSLSADITKYSSLFTLGAAALRLFKNEKLPFLICLFNMRTLEFDKWGESTRYILGYEAKEITGKKFEELVVPKYLEYGLETIDKNIKENYPVVRHQNEYYKKDGSTIKLTWYSDDSDGINSLAIGIPGHH